MPKEAKVSIFVTKGPPLPYTKANPYVIMDWTTEGKGIAGGVLMDDAYIATLSLGEHAIISTPDTGNILGLEVGAGRNGSNAMSIEDGGVDDDGPSGYVVAPYTATGSGKKKAIGDARFPVPRGFRFNRFEVWLKLPAEFQYTHAASLPTVSGRVQNIHCFGTFHADPADQVDDAEEILNWHFYFQKWIRYDLVEDLGENDGWIRVTCGDQPTHQRQQSSECPQVNPTALHGDFYETITRFYIAHLPSGADFSQDSGVTPIIMLVDSVNAYWEEPSSSITVTMDGYAEGEEVTSLPVDTDFFVDFIIHNFGASTFNGRIIHHWMNDWDGEYREGPVWATADVLGLGDDFDLTADETRTVTVKVKPTSGSSNTSAMMGVTIIDRDQIDTDPTGPGNTYRNRSANDYRVEHRGISTALTNQDYQIGASDQDRWGSHVWVTHV